MHGTSIIVLFNTGMQANVYLLKLISHMLPFLHVWKVGWGLYNETNSYEAGVFSISNNLPQITKRIQCILPFSAVVQLVLHMSKTQNCN
jgi:hypothetical protein